MVEHRRSKRVPGIGLTAFVHRADGSVREGVILNVSDHGISISGDATDLWVGDMVDVVAVVQGEKVRFAAEVRHLDPSLESFGVVFRSGPQAIIEQDTAIRHCKNCRRDFPPDCNYCSHCGQRLVKR